MKLLICLSVLVIGCLGERVRFDGFQVHRLYPKTEQQLATLRDLMSNNDYNFWTEVSLAGNPVDVMVSPNKMSEFETLLSEQGISKEIFVPDVQKLVDEEENTLKSRASKMEWTNYHSLQEFDEWLDDLVKTYKNVKKFVIGKTYEKRNINGIEITYGANFTTVFLEAGIHAREWISPASTSWMVNEILKSTKDSIWQKFNYVYVPFFNPDGYVFAWTTNRMWRKTRTPYKKGSITCYGADPNRNWDFHWNEVGGSSDPCSEIYPGPKAFSEVETKTISDWLSANSKSKKIDLYLSFHSYSQLIMYPWGWSPNPTPLSKTWKRIGDAAAKDLAAVNNEIFRVGDIYHIIYPASGVSMEWYYGKYNSTISYVYELRDRGQYGFVLPPKYILPSAKELYASVLRIVTEYAKLPPKY